MYLIGITGGSGSGKTTFAQKILKLVKLISNNVVILHMDSYYLSPQPIENYSKSGRPNFDHPDAFDWELLFDHLGQLKAGYQVQSPVYDFTVSKRTNETTKVGPAQIVLFEGIFTLYDQRIRNLLDIKCYLDVDSDIRFTRRLHRDVNERKRSLDSIIKQYYETVRPMYQKYLAPQRQYADFIVGEETDMAASILAAKVDQLLADETRRSELANLHKKMTPNETIYGSLSLKEESTSIKDQSLH